MKSLHGPLYIYLLFAAMLVVSRYVFRDAWPSDQYIVYNILSLLMITGALLENRGRKFVLAVPSAALIFLFLSPVHLKVLFIVLHILLLLIIILPALNPWKRLEYSAIPLEIMIILLF